MAVLNYLLWCCLHSVWKIVLLTQVFFSNKSLLDAVCGTVLLRKRRCCKCLRKLAVGNVCGCERLLLPAARVCLSQADELAMLQVCVH
jgi:hypothetical protein